MRRLEEIPVRVIGAGRPDGGAIGSGVYAILHEIVAGLERFEALGETAAIDLRSLPLTHHDYQCLRDTLGSGEVEATLHALGESRVRETGYHGVWWVQHRDPSNRVVGEIIEITDFPQILASPGEDVGEDLEQLRQRLGDLLAHPQCKPREAHDVTNEA